MSIHLITCEYYEVDFTTAFYVSVKSSLVLNEFDRPFPNPCRDM